MIIFYVSVILLFITLAIFHYLIFKDKTTKRFWILVDYFWISLGAISIFSFSLNFENFMDKSELENFKYDYHASISQLQNEISEEVEMFSKSEDLIGKEIKRKYLERENLFKEIGDSLLSNQDNLHKRNLAAYYLLRDISSKLDSGDYEIQRNEEIQSIISNIILTDDKITALDTKLNHDERNIFISFFGPLIFSIAIGIRLSKVTAQLKGKA